MSSLLVAVGTVVLLAFLLSFALGTQRNIRRGEDLLRWLQAGLPMLGARTKLRWFGSSAVQLDISEAKTPFSAAAVTVVLEPRDLSWLWAFARSRGRRDFLILRGSLEQAPTFELEAGGEGWTGHDRLARIDWTAWQRAEWSGGVEVAHTAGAAPEAMEAVWRRLAAPSGGVWRLSVRRDEPHVEVHVRPPRDTEETPDAAVALIQGFRDLASAAARGG